MPELKNLFVQGKMNKDLEERLIPQGEYIDAVNIDVAEGDEIGILKKVAGVQELSILPSDMTDAKCIGSVADTKNNKIYWFITSSVRDVIYELHIAANQWNDSFIKAVVVDKHDNITANKILKFSTSSDNYITGVNVLDGVLYFTDNLNEPKQVDIAYWKSQTPNSSNTSTGLSEDRITVIKKSPLQAPIYGTLANKTRTGAGTEGYQATAITTTYDFYDDEINDSVTFTAGGYNEGPNWEVGDVIIFSATFSETNGAEVKGEVRVKISTIADVGNNSNIAGVILTKSNIITQTTSYVGVLEDIDPIFKLKFPRFAYRYKYRNGQYSCLSPFSLPAFIPGDFEYDSKNSYNLGMENSVRQIILRGWHIDFLNNPTGDPETIAPQSDNYEADIEEIEVVYKDSESTNIYIVDTIKKDSNGNFATNLEIKDKQIFKVIQSNQLLRSFDSVPRIAKSQEVVANRLIYGNYKHNFNFNEDVEFDIDVADRTSATELTQKLSLKTDREYQIGVAFKDEYGRQTPVFSNKTGVVKIKDFLAKNNLQFKAKLGVPSLPSDFTHYKYFIKETSNEYYNLVISGVYQDTEGYLYLNSPSNEINKVAVDDILTIKKHNGASQYNATENKLKVIDVLTSSPDFLKQEDVVSYRSDHIEFALNPAADVVEDTLTPGITPVKGHNTIQLREAYKAGDNVGTNPHNSDQVTDEFIAAFIVGKSVKFKRPGTSLESKKYTIKSATTLTAGGTSHQQLELVFEEEFGEDVNVIYDDPTSGSSAYDCQMIAFTTEIKTDLSKYTGSFFIKVKDDSEIRGSLLVNPTEEDLITSATTRLGRPGDTYTNREYILFEARDVNESRGTSFNIGGTTGTATYNYHVILRTTRPYDEAANQYSNDFFGNSIKKGNWLRLTGEADAASGNHNPSYKIKDANFVDSTLSGSTVRFWFIEFDRNLQEQYCGWANLTVTSDSSGSVTVQPAGTSTQLNGIDTTDIYVNMYAFHDDFPADSLVTDVDYTNGQVIINKLPTSGGTGARTDIEFKRNANDADANCTSLGDMIADTREFFLEKTGDFTNPPIFEVEPKEGVLDIYYETEKTYPVSDINASVASSFERTLEYTNCFSFGNGVESDRIRDDYNAPTLGKGVRVSTTFEDNYQEETLETGLIFSGIYNSKNGVNRLNQFIIAEPITKELNPEYGSIQKLHTRDTDLITFCEDKVLKVLANKDALFNADGNVNVTSNTAVLGQSVPFAGEYGISKNPESFASHAYRVYFTDSARNKVLRLSLDGITEISDYGMKSYFKTQFRGVNNLFNAPLVKGSFNVDKNQYNVTFGDSEVNNDYFISETVTFSESVKGWPSRKTFVPESGLSLNGIYYTFKNGGLYSHNSSEKNKFYDGAYHDSSVTFVLNQSPSTVKDFKTLNYHGTSDWVASIASPLTGIDLNSDAESQHVEVDSWIKKEGRYYNYIKGKAVSSVAELDLQALNVQGLGTPTVTSGSTGTFDSLNSALGVGDKIYNTSTSPYPEYEVTAINDNVVTINAPTFQPNVFWFFAKDNRFEKAGVLGEYIEITMTHDASAENHQGGQLFSVGSEVSLSS
jgi:hypothetical protein